ncbi:hypothetical protein DAMA08_019680 [Martiniozyma asiatica (nom. inval.)]|nr:hypothetical protein DAMA08_019680 [Martiniozyma asiatica]
MNHIATFQAITDDLTGKDKIAKVIQYALRVVRLNSSNPTLIATLAALSVYRQLLRAGTVPFRLIRLATWLKNYIKGKAKIDEPFMYMLGNLYYAIMDESLLLYKLGMLATKKSAEIGGYYTGKKVFNFLEDHECYAWFWIIVQGMMRDWEQLSKLRRERGIVKLELGVLERTGKVVGGYDKDAINEKKETLKVLDDKIRLLWVNFVRLGCDLFYDSVFVFHLKLDKKWKPFHYGLGVMSGLLGCWKVWEAKM